MITLSWFNSCLVTYIVASLDKVLYDNYLCFVVASNKYWSSKSTAKKVKKINQKTWKIGKSYTSNTTA